MNLNHTLNLLSLFFLVLFYELPLKTLEDKYIGIKKSSENTLSVSDGKFDE
tara:strand:- start:1049 stop:1201 length:153 start_codon:yes stop_codon:yes gene_type:complete